jgi:hypothetical protein
MAGTTYRLGDMKTYTLEVYAPGDRDRLLWKRDSDQPFTPMNIGHRLQLPEAPGARRDEMLLIQEVEHMIWSLEDDVRYVTRLFTGLAPAT